MKQYFTVGLIVFGMSVCSSLYAHALSKPTGPVILTVTGNITNTNTDNKTAEFDREMLLKLEVVEQKTTTPWSEGVDLYRGPLLKSLMAVLGVKSGTLTVTALNDFSAVVPVEDAYDYKVILAMDINGQPMSVRTKGPLFLLYPFSDVASLNNEVIYNRSVWQIKSISVE
jgi:hypothetical protein